MVWYYLCMSFALTLPTPNVTPDINTLKSLELELLFCYDVHNFRCFSVLYCRCYFSMIIFFDVLLQDRNLTRKEGAKSVFFGYDVHIFQSFSTVILAYMLYFDVIFRSFGTSPKPK